MLWIIGLGLSEKGYGREAYDAILKADTIYAENYTVEFPYPIKSLESQFKGKKFLVAGRDFVEGLEILESAKRKDVVLLVYGSPLMATTHISLVEEAKKRKIKVKVIHSASVFDAVAETGLQLYKFGKTASMPGFEADSYMEIVGNNLGINAHTLILIDIGLGFKDAVEKLSRDADKNNVEIKKIVVCSRLGNKDGRIYYGDVKKLKSREVKSPFCIIVPSRKLHFMEEEFLKNYAA
jgi:diphthine synthase